MKKFFLALWPFLITLFLWRLTVPVINPLGILALIPIYYYSIVRPRPYFLPMAIIGCALLDYNFGTMLLWTILFCIIYSVYALAPILRPGFLARGGAWSFMVMLGIGLLILGIRALALTGAAIALWQMLWMFILCTAGYFVCGRIIREK